MAVIKLEDGRIFVGVLREKKDEVAVETPKATPQPEKKPTKKKTK
jgi:hypothetical protein